MLKRNKITLTLALLLTLFSLAPSAANAKPSEYELIVNHLKTKYHAKKVKIPLIWLARFAVSVVHPAGVKSFNVTLFEDLKFSRETLDTEMRSALQTSMGAGWDSLLRVRSREGEQVYMYMREAGKSGVKIMLVMIDQKEGAAIVRATVNPERLADFVNNPKMFGISLDDKTEHPENNKTDESASPKAHKEETKKDN